MATLADHEPLRPVSANQMEALEEATFRYEAALTGDDRALSYLEGRGLAEVASGFRLGVVADPEPGHGRFVDWLSIPYLDHRDRPLTMRFRCIDPMCGVGEKEHHEGHGKYMSLTDEPARVFNVRAIHEADMVIHVAEGEFDAMVLSMLGMPAVAIPGAAGWQGHHAVMLAGFQRVWVWGDPDDAGAEFTQRVCRSLRQARGVRLRVGDVGDTYLHGGAEALHSLITEA